LTNTSTSNQDFPPRQLHRNGDEGTSTQNSETTKKTIRNVDENNTASNSEKTKKKKRPTDNASASTSTSGQNAPLKSNDEDKSTPGSVKLKPKKKKKRYYKQTRSSSYYLNSTPYQKQNHIGQAIIHALSAYGWLNYNSAKWRKKAQARTKEGSKGGTRGDKSKDAVSAKDKLKRNPNQKANCAIQSMGMPNISPRGQRADKIMHAFSVRNEFNWNLIEKEDLGPPVESSDVSHSGEEEEDDIMDAISAHNWNLNEEKECSVISEVPTKFSSLSEKKGNIRTALSELERINWSTDNRKRSIQSTETPCDSLSDKEDKIMQLLSQNNKIKWTPSESEESSVQSTGTLNASHLCQTEENIVNAFSAHNEFNWSFNRNNGCSVQSGDTLQGSPCSKKDDDIVHPFSAHNNFNWSPKGRLAQSRQSVHYSSSGQQDETRSHFSSDYKLDWTSKDDSSVDSRETQNLSHSSQKMDNIMHSLSAYEKLNWSPSKKWNYPVQSTPQRWEDYNIDHTLSSCGTWKWNSNKEECSAQSSDTPNRTPHSLKENNILNAISAHNKLSWSYNKEEESIQSFATPETPPGQKKDDMYYSQKEDQSSRTSIGSHPVKDDNDHAEERRTPNPSPPKLWSKKITPWEWQILVITMRICLRAKEPVLLRTLHRMLFQHSKCFYYDFIEAFGTLFQFLRRHRRVFFIYERKIFPEPVFEISLKIVFAKKLLRSRQEKGLFGVLEGKNSQEGVTLPKVPVSFGSVTELDLDSHHNCALYASYMVMSKRMEMEIIKITVELLFFDEEGSCTLRELGQVLQRKIDNPKLPGMFKQTYGGLKKFFIYHRSIFMIKKHHQCNPVITLNPSFLKVLRPYLGQWQAAQTKTDSEASEKTSEGMRQSLTVPTKNIEKEKDLSHSKQNQLRRLATPELISNPWMECGDCVWQTPARIHAFGPECFRNRKKVRNFVPQSG